MGVASQTLAQAVVLYVREHRSAAQRAGQLAQRTKGGLLLTHVEDDGLRQGLGGDAHMLLQGFAIAAPMQPSVLRNWLQSRR